MKIKFQIDGIDFQVWPGVVHGEDRGGEDLFLYVSATSGSEPPTEPVSRERLDRALREAANDATFDSYEPGTRVEHVEGEYQHEYRADWETFVDDVLGITRDPDWKFSRKSGTWSFESELFVDGNAD